MPARSNLRIGLLPTDIVSTISGKLEGQESSLRIATLPHPRTGLPALFLLFNGPTKSALYEIQSISPSEPRSLFLEEQVVSDGSLMLMTEIDPTLLLIPFMQAVHPVNGSLGHFRPAEDLLYDVSDMLAKSESQIKRLDILQMFALDCCKIALSNICDSKEAASDLIVYRYSHEKTLRYLRGKVDRLSFPTVIEKSRTMTRYLANLGLMEDGKEELLGMGRLKVGCQLLGQYLSTEMRRTLTTSYDFTKLEEHSSKMISTNDGMQKQTPKKTKSASNAAKASASATTDKKRKGAKASAGVEKLKKVNTEGMSKLSSFFKKK